MPPLWGVAVCCCTECGRRGSSCKKTLKTGSFLTDLQWNRRTVARILAVRKRARAKPELVCLGNFLHGRRSLMIAST